ncbi:triple tyrosine motif-containing protein [Duganella sp.]|uniref:sensor histidine kinase n=1 Tax=Duganella sp. TaxID=1904440 RepID=UPI0031E11A8D
MLARFLLLLALLPHAAQALNPLTPLSEYNRASWSTRDGAPPEIHSMAQTRDGRLWMTSPNGLYRFDGLRFEKQRLPGNEEMARRRVSLARAHPNGDLYLSYAMAGGLSVLHPDGRLEDLIPLLKIPPLSQLAFDDNGDIWALTAGGLFRVRDRKAQPVQVGQSLAKEVADIRIDRYGRLWVTTLTALYQYDRASGKFDQVRPLTVPASLIESPDGRVWTASPLEVRALPAPAGSAARMGKPNMVNQPGVGSDWIARFDRDGNLWQLKCPTDLCVTPAHVVAATDVITVPQSGSAQPRPAGPANVAGNTLIEDREHNIWVATLEGLDRYRDNRLHRHRLPVESSPANFTMVTDENGQVWTVDNASRSLWRLQAGSQPERDPVSAQLVSRDFSGALLVAGPRDIERRKQGRVDKIALPEIPGPDGKPRDLMIMGVTDDGKRLWLVTAQTGLIGRRGDGPWEPRAKFNLPPNIVLGVPGVKAGQLWIACGDGSIVLLDENDKLTSYPAPMIGLATGIYTGEDIVASGDQGLAVLVKGAFRQLRGADPEALQDISGYAVTPDGDRWLNGGKGLVHVRRDDWKASVANPELPLRYELFGLKDGYVGKAMLYNRHPSAKVDKDGHLWLVSTGGLLRFNTREIPRNAVAPVADVDGVHTGTASYKVEPGLTLPPGSKNLNITYTAASLRQPEAVRFQYRLDGADGDWQDAGPRRAAYYTNMEPGAYRFRVRAANEDGVWSEQPASVDFEIPATFTQTPWFKAACALAVALALYLLYLYRLRVVTARLEERMEVRLAERERIARTLHDTFLQTVQGVVLRLDAAVDTLPDDSAARTSLTTILHSARDGINEGRAQVQELRSSEADEIECRLRDVAALLAASYPGVQFVLEVSGTRCTLRAGVVDEISEIGREAVRNAYQHAQAARIDVQLTYGAEQFTLQVRDDGKGMSPAPAAGHWGLVGMRERAARVGAALQIDSTQNSGTTITITLSARRAYAGRKRSWWRGLFGL